MPSAALGQGAGGAAGDQYQEQTPSATGNNGSSGSGDASGSGSPQSSGGGSDSSSDSGTEASGSEPTSGGGSTIDPSTVKKFSKDGNADGTAAAGLAQGTAPDSQALRNATQQAQDGSGTDSASTVFDSPSAASSNDDGMGIALPIILGLILIGGIAYFFVRRGDLSGDSFRRLRDQMRPRKSSRES